MYHRLPTREGYTAGIIEDIDKFFNDFLKPYSTGTFATYGKSQSPRLNAYKKNGKYCLEVFVPFASKGDIDLTIDERVLKISVAGRQDKEVSAADYIIREVSRGQCVREIALGDDIDVDSIETKLDSGVLYITFAAIENQQQPKVRKIEIS